MSFICHIGNGRSNALHCGKQYLNIEIPLGFACMFWSLISRFGVTEALGDLFFTVVCRASG